MIGSLFREHPAFVVCITISLAATCCVVARGREERARLQERLDIAADRVAALETKASAAERHAREAEQALEKARREAEDARAEAEQARRAGEQQRRTERDRAVTAANNAERARFLDEVNRPAPGSICSQRAPAGECVHWLVPVPQSTGPSLSDRMER